MQGTLTREKNVNHKNVNRTRTQGADAVHANGDAKVVQILSTQVKVAVPYVTKLAKKKPGIGRPRGRSYGGERRIGTQVRAGDQMGRLW